MCSNILVSPRVMSPCSPCNKVVLETNVVEDDADWVMTKVDGSRLWDAAVKVHVAIAAQLARCLSLKT